MDSKAVWNDEGLIMQEIEKIQIFQNVGICFQEGMERFIKNEELYIKYLCAFLFDGSLEELYTSIELGEWEAASKAAWTLKGTAANLAMEKLAESLEELLQVLELSAKGQLDLEKVQELLAVVRQVYEDNCTAIDQVYYKGYAE